MKQFLTHWYHKIFSNIHGKYRLVIMNETFEERFSFRMSRLNVFVTVGMTIITLTLGTLVLVAFTSLREFIPGYTRSEIVDMAFENQVRIDSLETLVGAQERMLFAMGLAISGEIQLEDVTMIRDSVAAQNYADIVFTRSIEDDMLREQVEQGEKFNLAQQIHTTRGRGETPENIGESARGAAFSTQSMSNMLFYVPLEGTILSDFDLYRGHLGMDITGKRNDVIKAVQNGMIVMSEWTLDDNYVVMIQHSNNLMSVYRHNSAVLKGVGDFVISGEPIAFIGNSGEGYKGPILHFELWYGDSPINPRHYIAF